MASRPGNPPRPGVQRALRGLVGLALGLGLCACAPDPPPPAPPDELAIVWLAAPSVPGAAEIPERPPVAFPHDRHTRELAAEGCAACHPPGPHGRFVPETHWQVAAGPDREARRAAYHAGCQGCHERRAEAGLESGPRACAACHVPPASRPAGLPRAALAYDYALHARHVAKVAAKPDESCRLCHHAPDPQTGRLAYVAGGEARCNACHGAAPDGRRPALREAVHAACLDCHLRPRPAGESAGPTPCAGCHDARRQAQFKTPKPLPVLPGKRDPALFVKAAGARVPPVAFDHRRHESPQVAPFCTTCHHRTLGPCERCHTQVGHPRGGGVTREQAFHGVEHAGACVGCHVARGSEGPCVACHTAAREAPGPLVCGVCHAAGPGAAPAADAAAVAIPRAAGPEAARATAPSSAAAGSAAPLPAAGSAALTPAAAAAAVASRREVPPVPAASADFPAELQLGALTQRFAPARFPHRKIALALDRIVRTSPLARRFHADGHVLCAGCHHGTPPEARPPACGSCHGLSPHPTVDRPALEAAYHRLCLGCHERLGLPTRCDHCHAPAPVASPAAAPVSALSPMPAPEVHP